MGFTWLDAATTRSHAERVRAATDKPFQVNYALSFPPDHLQVALDVGVPIITFSWGDPAPFTPLVRRAGAKFGIAVANALGAKQAMDLGPDFLICQGMEAGGHVQSTTPLWVVLEKVLEVAGQTPVVAAGGIGDGEGIANALKRGASGAMLGTRFVATVESEAHPLYKEQLVLSKAEDTALTGCFEAGWPYSPHRVLRNGTFTRWEAAGCPQVGSRPGEGEIVGTTKSGDPIYRYEGAYPAATYQGDVLDMCLYSGTSCSAIHDIPSAGDLVKRLWDDAQRSLVP